LPTPDRTTIKTTITALYRSDTVKEPRAVQDAFHPHLQGSLSQGKAAGSELKPNKVASKARDIK
jgi:hypothetical protein